MAALEPQYMAILKKVLAERFMPFLPPLLGAAKPEDQAAKQLSRAFSAFALHKLLDITPQAAAASVVDDFNDKGIDTVHYDEDSETLYLLQTKLKESEQFKQDDALPFCDGIRLLIRPKATKNGIKKFKVRGLSIINGAQTVASAAEFVTQHPGSNIDDAKVMLTLIKAPADGSFGKHVTKARNHLNPVQTANFASLDENQERLRQEIAHLGFDYHYRPEASATGSKAISLDEALRALASQQDDPRYAVWLKSEPARLANPESAEYQSLFPATLTGAALVNAVLCHRAIRTLMVDYEQKAAEHSQEKLIYRHALHVIAAVMMKRLRQRISTAAVIDPASIPALISQPLDQFRQQTFDLGRQRLLGEGPLAYFRNQGSVASFMADLIEAHFELTADPVLPNLRNIKNAADAYPRKRLLDYLSGKAQQL